MSNAIDILESFEQRLIDKGLMIVPKNEWLKNVEAADLRRLQEKYLRRNWLTFKQIIDAQLLDVSTKNAIRYKIKQGLIKPEEVVKDAVGKIKVATIAIKRLRDELE